MTYEHAIEYLFSQLPNYQDQGGSAYKPDIGNIVSFCNELGNPQRNFKSVHLAGTNGKGSVAHIIASALQTGGYQVGIYSSPHLLDFRERIKINGEYISKEKVVDFVSAHTEYCEKSELSFFEWTTALAFEHFNEQSVDIALIETGLGGRLDSTNIIEPVLSIITTIGLDHINILGTSLEEIAREKAGIVKPGTPVLLGAVDATLHSIFRKKAGEHNAPVHIGDQSIDFRADSDLKPGYQNTNLSIAHDACKLLEAAGFRSDFRNGIKNVASTTGLLGRWQVVDPAPLTIVDCAHNEQGIGQCMEELEKSNKQIHFVFGTVTDKDHNGIFRLLPKGARYYFCTSSNHRGMNSAMLQEKAAEFGLRGRSYPTVKEAIISAQKTCGHNDMIFVGGSTFVAADALLVF